MAPKLVNASEALKVIHLGGEPSSN